MLITRVELEDIKSHRSYNKEFTPGINAICGPNGSGKTTILEAIGYALFDYLPYSQDDFIRRGAKKGTVKISFISSLDDLEYTVIRNCGRPGYQVYDPRLGGIVANLKENVQEWLRQHLGVEHGVSLADLFQTTIGVPQGTFTTDFLKPTTARKAVFDPILKVEEYKQTWDALKETVRFIEDRITQHQMQIEVSRSRTAELPELQSYLVATTIESEALKQDERRLREDHTLLEQKLTHWQGLADLIRQQENQLQKQRDMSQFLMTQAERLRSDRARHLQIAAWLEEMSPILSLYATNREALAKQPEWERQRQKQHLATQRTQLEIQQSEKDYQRLIDEQHELSQLKQDLPLWEERAARQTELESQRDRLKQQIARLGLLRESQTTTQQRYAQVIKDSAEAARELAQLDQIEPLKARELELKNKLDQLAIDLRQDEERKREWEDKQRETEALSTQLREAEARQINLSSQIALVEPDESIAAQRETLEARWQEDKRAKDELIGRIQSDREWQGKVSTGLCPLLSCACPVVGADGLTGHFTAILVEHERLLSHQEVALSGLQETLDQARTASQRTINLPAWRREFEEITEKIERSRSRLNEIAVQMSENPYEQASHQDRQKQQSACQAEREELMPQLAKLGLRQSWQERLENSRSEENRLSEELEKLTDEIAGLDSASQDLTTCEATLVALGEARERARHISERIAGESLLASRLTDLESQLKSAKQDYITIVHQRLRYDAIALRFELLSQQQAAWEGVVTQAQHHQAEIANQDVTIAQLAETEAKLEEVSGSLIEDEAQLIEWQRAYDETAHRSDQQLFTACKEDVVRVATKLDFLGQQIAALNSRIAQLDHIAQAIAEKEGELFADEERLAFAQLARQTIRDAGPKVTEAYVQNISIEADRLFCEISGQHEANLTWQSDYNIVLSERGYDRPFANLSGGEQMAAALSIRLAMLKELSVIDTAFFDEPTTNMDEERRRNLAQQLAQIQGFRQLFVISHDDTFEVLVDNTVHLGDESPTLDSENRWLESVS